MSDKENLIVITRGPRGFIYRYAIEYPIAQDEIDFEDWFNDVVAYFKERTSINEEVMAVEQAEFLTHYRYRDVRQK